MHKQLNKCEINDTQENALQQDNSNLSILHIKMYLSQNSQIVKDIQLFLRTGLLLLSLKYQTFSYI